MNPVLLLAASGPLAVPAREPSTGGREEVFEFLRKPQFTRQGEDAIIAFETNRDPFGQERRRRHGSLDRGIGQGLGQAAQADTLAEETLEIGE